MPRALAPALLDAMAEHVGYEMWMLALMTLLIEHDQYPMVELDPVHASRSTLEVKTRRLLVDHGITDFVRELPLQWNSRTYRYDFGFERQRMILETNGGRWHDDPADYERDNEKWSVPARHGSRIVFATWDKVVRHPHDLVQELVTTMG